MDIDKGRDNLIGKFNKLSKKLKNRFYQLDHNGDIKIGRN